MDGELPQKYENVISGFGFAIVPVGTDTDAEAHPDDQRLPTNLQSLHTATLRQIGYEVLNSPELLNLQNQQ